MLVVARFTVDENEGGRFAEQAGVALDALAARPGYLRGRVGRAVDDPASWILLTEWDGVGSYRRALSAYEVRVHATPLLARSSGEPSAFEVLLSSDGVGAPVPAASDRAADAGTTGSGRPPVPPSDPVTPRQETP